MREVPRMETGRVDLHHSAPKRDTGASAALEWGRACLPCLSGLNFVVWLVLALVALACLSFHVVLRGLACGVQEQRRR